MIEEYEVEILLNPYNLFNNVDEVKEFVEREPTLESLSAFLLICIEEQLYEYCVVIQDKINQINDEY